MTIPPNVRVNAQLPFPSLVVGSGPITITKANGIWTIGFSTAGFGIQSPPIAKYPTDYALVYDSIARAFFNVSLTSLVARSPPNTQSGTSYTLDATSGAGTDWALIFSNTGAVTLTLPAASLWTGRVISVKNTAGGTLVSANSNVVPLAGGAAAMPILAAGPGKWSQLQSNGTNWVVMMAN